VNEITSLDILLIAAAIIYSWRLHYPGHPPPEAGKTADNGPRTAPRSPAVVSGASTPPASLPDRLQAVCRACGMSRIEEFIAGARSAHEAIVSGFAKGELDCLPLVPELRVAFDAEISARRLRGEEVTLTLVALQAADIADGGIEDRTAWISVRFTDLLAMVTRDRDGKVVSGHPTVVGEVVEIWTFEKDLGSRDPSWLLMATEASSGEDRGTAGT
jgi:predicted lipid-binding transport protein (Tim44 family)